jgi:RNA polymerase sporulation-specific sigma factor
MRASHQNTDLYFSDMGEQLLHKQVASKAILVEDAVAQGERFQNRIRQIEASLSSFEQQVLLHYLRGHSYQRIASILGGKPKSVDNALQRVRRKLRPSGEDQA